MCSNLRFCKGLCLIGFGFQTDKGGNHRLPHGFGHFGRQPCGGCLPTACGDDLGDAFGCGNGPVCCRAV